MKYIIEFTVYWAASLLLVILVGAGPELGLYRLAVHTASIAVLYIGIILMRRFR
jgi:hypothetical protein